MEFEFVCWDCEADCVVYGERTGFWGTRFELPSDWDCWNCGANNSTPAGPWTPAYDD